MPFTPFKQWAEQDTETYIIGNSQTLNIGDTVYMSQSAGSGGFVYPVLSTTALVYGVVVGFVASPGGASQQNLQATQVIASSTNQTVNQYRARVLPARQARLFLVDLNQTAGTTSGSGDPGFFSINTTNQGQLTETTYVVLTGTAGQFFSTGSGYASSDNGPSGLFPATSTQVIGFFSSKYTV